MSKTNRDLNIEITAPKFILHYKLSGLNLSGATFPTHKQRQRYIKKLCNKAFYIIHTKQTENWLNRGQNIQTIDVYKLKYLYQMQNLLKSIHLQIFQPFPNSNWIGASKSQQKTKICFTCKTGSDDRIHWNYHRCTSRYLHKRWRHSLPFIAPNSERYAVFMCWQLIWATYIWRLFLCKSNLL